MDEYKYMRGLLRTENHDFKSIAKRFFSEKMIRLNHAALGIASETMELLEAVEKFEGSRSKDLTLRDKVIGEMGDVWWFTGLAFHSVGVAGIPNLGRLRESYIHSTHTGLVPLFSFVEEFVTKVKAQLYYDRDIRDPHLLADLRRIAFSLDMLTELYSWMPSTFDIWEANLAKLSSRHGDKFSDTGANIRNESVELDAIRVKI